MSAIDPTATAHAPGAEHGHDPHGHSHAHPPHLAHHFDTPEQQFDASKLGMWSFLATEVLMFGGLFCAYAVYRYNNPNVFRYGEHHVDTFWGALNTIILLTSSLTMAMGVRAAQLGKQTVLVAMLVATILGGGGFMVIKAIEYNDKWSHGLFPGQFNRYDRVQNPEDFAAAMLGPGEHAEEGHAGEGDATEGDHGEGAAADHPPAPGERAVEPTQVGGERAQGSPLEHQEPGQAQTDLTAQGQQPPLPELSHIGPGYRDPNYGTGDAAQIRPTYQTRTGVVDARGAAHEVEYGDLALREQVQVSKFFNIYFMMTGLHGLHVVIGIALILWILVRAASAHRRKVALSLAVVGLGVYLFFVGYLTSGHLWLPFAGVTSTGMWWVAALVTLAGLAWLAFAGVQSRQAAVTAGEFGPEYFTPVDLVGLYWHLVDLIWIFLFPLLYLIH